ncbi:hypothetical protein BJX63DRAFT_426088 [Aspergillus granulosus]|uniref:Protein kinase domain-containing protein n=1 Tax=Aspergillus granulosus TaxID=176169 RepID=A0ABR4GTL5_9EURO
MARTVIRLELRPAPGSRPADLFNKILQLRAKIPYEQRFYFEIRNSRILVEQIDKNTVVLLTKGFGDALNPDSDPPLKYYTDEDHMCNLIGNHPRLVRFLGRDPWTALPTLEKPSATLAGFLEEHHSTIGSGSGNGNGRLYLTAPYRPLIFQWALQLLTGLSFVHSKDVILGDLHKYTCWLQSPGSLSILGFLDAVYMEPTQAIKYTNDTWGTEYNFPFHPCLISGKGTGPGGRWDRDMATIQTDLFLWASLLYELLTGSWPARGRVLDDVKAILTHKLWPKLDEEDLDEIARKCWDYEYVNADEVKRDLGKFLAGKGWEVEGVEGDEIKGLDIAQILAS